MVNSVQHSAARAPLVLSDQVYIGLSAERAFAPAHELCGQTLRTRDDHPFELIDIGDVPMVTVRTQRGFSLSLPADCIPHLLLVDRDPVIWSPPCADFRVLPACTTLLDEWQAGPNEWREAGTGFIAGMVISGGHFPQEHNRPASVTLEDVAAQTLLVVRRILEKYSAPLSPHGKPFLVFEGHVANRKVVRSRRIELALAGILKHPGTFDRAFSEWSSIAQKCFIAGLIAGATAHPDGRSLVIRTRNDAIFSAVMQILLLHAGIPVDVIWRTQDAPERFRSGWNSITFRTADIDRAVAMGLVFEVPLRGYVPTSLTLSALTDRIVSVRDAGSMRAVRVDASQGTNITANGFAIRSSRDQSVVEEATEFASMQEFFL